MTETRYGAGTALVVVDVQNDFAHPDGSLAVAGAGPAVAAVRAEIDAATAAGSPVVYTQDWHPPRTPHFATDGGAWPVHCVRDTWGAELVEGLPVIGPVVRKGVDGGDGYSGFTVRDPTSGDVYDTELGRVLREQRAVGLVVVGIALDVCVKDTVLDALARGFDVTVVRAATAAVDLQPGDGDAAVVAMRAAGAEVL